MWEGLRKRLVISAAGRNLAIDLAEEHGAAAAERLERLIARGGADDFERAVLSQARGELSKIRFYSAAPHSR